MSSIPLAALDVKPPQPQESPIQSVGGLLQLKSMLQAQQEQPLRMQMLQQQAEEGRLTLQSQKAFQDAFADPSLDPTAPDYYDKALQLATKKGALPQQTLAIQEKLDTHRKTLADTDATVLKSASDRADRLAGIASTALAVPEGPDRDALLQSHLKDAVSGGLVSPQQAQNVLGGKHDDQTLTLFKNGLIGEKALHDEAIQNQEANAKDWHFNEALGTFYNTRTKETANAGQNLDIGTAHQLIDQVVPPTGPQAPLNARTKQQYDFFAKQGNFKQANEVLSNASSQVGALEKEKFVQQQENYRQGLNRQAQFANELQKNGLSQLDKIFTDPQHGYVQFLSQAQATKNAVRDARNGNELAASLTPLMTALGVTSYAGVHRINQTEVAQAGSKVGSLYRQLNSILDKAGEGTIPAATAKEVNSLMDGLIDARYAATTSGAQMVARNAGLDATKTTVFDRDGNLKQLSEVSAPTKPATSAATFSVKAPNGKTYYFSDQQSADNFRTAANIPK